MKSRRTHHDRADHNRADPQGPARGGLDPDCHGDRIVLGYMVFSNFPDKKAAAQIAGYISIFSDVFCA